ncbi:leucyl aminopeptidase family protein [Alteromonas sp. SM 2104]|nr:leucyl aminopeptidase family protein [Alteromonas oceanisediminis]
MAFAFAGQQAQALEVRFANTQSTPLSGDVLLLVDSPEAISQHADLLGKNASQRLTDAMTSFAFDDTAKTRVLYGIMSSGKVLIKYVPQQQLAEKSALSQWQSLGGQAIALANQHEPTDNLHVIVGSSSASSAHLAHFAAGAALRSYRFDKYKTTPQPKQASQLVVHSTEGEAPATLYTKELAHLVEGVSFARNMSSEPGKTIYPQAFVDQVTERFSGLDNVTITVLDVAQMTEYNMGALLGVGQGSIHEPRLLIIEYRGANDDTAPIALAGKGITFDTGGISLKRNDGMWAMKSDLSGAAAVAGTMLATAKRNAKINVVGLMPLAENMPAEDAIRPGDVLTTMQGTTIEIISTDAEGRLILADAVTYAQQQYQPKLLLNIATLTGSAARALSDEYAALITRDWALSEQMMALGERSGEAVWPLPLHPNHDKQIESDIADIKNSGAGNPGASIGAAVIGTFVADDLPWIHLDIAGVDYLSEATDIAPKGASGWGVRFMDALLREHETPQ